MNGSHEPAQRKNIYTPEDVAGLDLETGLGAPGEYPFTRGTHASGYAKKKWTIRQVMGLGPAEETNERLRHLLDQGQTGISLTGLGYAPFESADERADGLVGRGGIWVDTLADMEDVFKEIPIGEISINQTGNSIPAFCMILAVAKQRGVALEGLRGTVQNYVLPWGDAPLYRGNHYIDIVEFCSSNVPRWNHTSVSVRNTRESGISAAQEIAFGIHEGYSTVAAAAERGCDVNMVGRGVSFFLNAENDFLEEVAKFRAMRRLWARTMRERAGATDDRACLLRFHVQTSGVSLTAQQPLNNVVRATLHALAAVMGGANSMSVNAFDEAFTIPSELAQTLSIRTQQIIQLESGVTSVIDPFGGSYAVESLTAQLEAEALEIFEGLSALGPAEARSQITAACYEAAYQRQLDTDSGERPVIGVNCFEEEEGEDLFTSMPKKAAPDYDNAWRDKQVGRLQKVKVDRDDSAVVTARSRLVDAYRGKESIIEPVLEAVESYMSIGEIVDALSDVTGPQELRKRGGFVTRLY